MKVYHKSFSSVCNEVINEIEQRGFSIDNDEWFTKVSCRYKANPDEGNTSQFHITLYKNGKQQRKMLHFQVYNMGNNTLELNLYIN